MIYTAVLVDDEQDNIENLEMLLNEFCSNVSIQGTATSFNNAKELIVSSEPDILFLDIQMGNQQVFELLEELEVITSEIIFVTAYEDYAIQSYDFNTAGYILKPINIGKLQKSVEKAIANIQVKVEKEKKQTSSHSSYSLASKIAFPVKNGFKLKKIQDIQYLQAEGSYTNVFFVDKKQLLVSKNLGYYESRLEAYGFIRIHPSALINFQYVIELDRTDGGYIVMEQGTHLPISKSKRMELEKLIRQNW
ncbi:Response regulator transcription factor [Tenacibaculum sp. 190524A02b]|uniref:Response regulator transcription factor n=1 Tax=Tenacibaculum vairaonense TaxID=3137860 RepID=A0ABM9PHW8_9FLAO